MQSLLSPHGVYATADVDAALARVFGAGVRPLRMEQALFDAMLAGWRSQQAARYLKVKTIATNESGVRRFVEHVGCWPWEWRASHVDEYFEDLLARPQRLARSTLRAYQFRLKTSRSTHAIGGTRGRSLLSGSSAAVRDSCSTSATSSRTWTSSKAIPAGDR